MGGKWEEIFRAEGPGCVAAAPPRATPVVGPKARNNRAPQAAKQMGLLIALSISELIAPG